MSILRTRLEKQFSEKVYPNPALPEVAAQVAEGRKAFERDYLGRSFPWHLGGETFKSLREFHTHNPANRKQIVGTFSRFKRGEIPIYGLTAKVRSQGRHFATTVNWRERITLLHEISKVVQERFWLLCAAKMYETGQSLAEAIGETDEEVDFPLAAAMYLEEMNEETLLRSPPWSGDFSGKRYVPHGVFLNVAPFNFPGAIPMDMAAKALAMGNAVIEKSSDKSALCGYLVYESIVMAFERLGISHAGVVNYCPGGPEVVNMLLGSQDIAGVSFTGSSAALDEIRSMHGSMPRNKFHGRGTLTFGSTETSGVNIVIVWHDADIAHAASECAKSFLGRQGQKCSSARIIMVHDEVRDAFKVLLEAAVEKVRFGSVLDGADVGPCITQDAEANILRKVEKLDMLVGDMKYQKRTNIDPNIPTSVLPTIIYAGRDRSMYAKDGHVLMNTEIFGPVTTVVSVPNLDTVRALCALSEFALTGTSFTADPAVALELADVIPAGNMYFNRKCTGALVETECFGGLCSRSSPSGIKGKQALALFGSAQTISGFYPKGWDSVERFKFVQKMEHEHGVVFSKHNVLDGM